MTTPFKALNPFTPRFIEINYVAPDGGCCALSSSSGSQQSLPDDDPVPVPDNFQYFFQPPFGGYTWLMWMQDPSNPSQRILIEEFFIDGTDPVDITAFFLNVENTGLAGNQRKVFFTQANSTTSGTTEIAYYTNFSLESGTAFSLEEWDDVPEHEPLDGWVDGNDVQMVVIENYKQGHATFTISDPPLVLGPGSMMKAQSGSVWGRLDKIASYVFTDCTIQYWVKLLSSPAPQNFGQYFGHTAAGNVNNYRVTDGQLIFSAQNYLAYTSAGADSDLDTWVHWTYRIVGNVATIFKNGVPIVTMPTDPGTFDFFDTNHDLYFGQLRIPANEQQLAFRMCDFRMFNLGRTDEEILNTFEQRLFGTEPGLVAYYPMHETDSNFADYSGYNTPIFLKNLVGTGPSADIGWNADTPDCFA